MADYNVLKAAIADYVKDRTGLSTIDGDGLQETLLAIVNSIGVGYVFMGVADLTTNPGTPDQRVWYLAATAGIYANFNNITLDQYEIAVLKWDTEWHKEIIPDIPSKSQIDERLDEQDAEIDRRMDAQDGRLDAQDARLDGQDEEIADFKEAVQDQVDNYPMITIEGNVTNAPDEEDLTSVEENGNDVLKFKNRSAVDGMGYKILRKGGTNTFANQVTGANTIYEIRYDFDLGGDVVTIPDGSILKFNGGSLNNGTLNISDDFQMVGNGEQMNDIRLTTDENISNVYIYNLKFRGTVNDSPESVADLFGFLKSISYKTISNFTLNNCVITGYNFGIAVDGNNITISDCLFYGNGSAISLSGNIHDSEFDLSVSGQYVTEVSRKNIVIKNNRCLSQYVHRNIDVGENYFVDNIIIDGNICVSCDNNFDEVILARKAQCILVGYTGESSTEKKVIITNNICKNCSWGAIYVRADNTEASADTSKYVAIITNNIISNVYRNTDGHICGGILVELKEGSMIANNVISNILKGELSDVVFAINIGHTYGKGHTYVHNNFIKNADVGVCAEAVSRLVDICGNRIIDASRAISVDEAAESGVTELYKDRFVNVSRNFIRGCASGIRIYRVYAENVVLSDNSIIGDGNDDDAVAIDLTPRFSANFPALISGNKISSIEIGIQLREFSASRNSISGTRFQRNRFDNCGTAVGVVFNTTKQLFVIEDSIYLNCLSIFGNQSWARGAYDGKINQDGTYTIFDAGGRGDYNHPVYGYLTNPIVCFLPKLFKKGDVVIPTDARALERAICDADYSSADDTTVKWRGVDVRIHSAAIGIFAIGGQIAYDTTNKLLKFNDGTNWVSTT